MSAESGVPTEDGRGAASLRLLLCGLAGCSVELQPLPGATRPILRPQQLLLPAIAAAPSLQRRSQRAAVAHAVAHLRHSRAARSTRSLKPLALAVLSAIEDSRVEHLLAREAPGVRRWFAEFLPREELPGLDLASLLARLDRVLADPSLRDRNPWVDSARLRLLALPDLRDAEAFHRLGLVLANELGQMRVPFDPEQAAAGAPYRDDHSYLWDHGRTAEGDPLPDLRSQGVAKPGTPRESEHEIVPVLREAVYAEWNQRLGRWREGWCTVQERLAPRPALAPAAAQHATEAQARHALRPDRRLRLQRQPEGETLDLAAAVAARVDRRRGLAWDPRLFQRPARTPRRASVLLLLDLSQSTQSPCPAAATVLEAEKQAALQLARHALTRGDRVAIHGFSSNTRAEVAYWRALDFGSALDASALAALQALQPRHSTRLGAALRHAHALLARETSERRLLLLLSDGEPSDIDVFDSEHLLHDARSAVEQARGAGLRTACVAFDPAARESLATVFGRTAVCIADGPAALARRLPPFVEGTLIA